MEKQVKKPDWTEVIAMADLFDYFKTVKNEKSRNELFDRELLKYKEETQRDEVPEFIDIQIEKITGMIEKVKTVKDYTKFNEYRNAKFYLNYLHTKQTEQSDIKPTAPEPIIKREYLTFIHLRFKEWIKEPPDIWVERFIKDGSPVDRINIESEAKEGSRRLVILAILEAIHLAIGNAFDYQKFVNERFGISAFYKAKGVHEVKKGYIDTLKECNDILKKMTPFES